MIQKQKELSLDKKYGLPKYVIVPYECLKIAVFPNIANWILLKNTIQENIFHSIADDKLCVQKLMDAYRDNQGDLVYVLTQIEAKQIEQSVIVSNFVNKKLHLHLTNKCNLRCPHCYMKSGVSDENELTTDEVLKLIENFKNIADGTSIDITGGEPIVRKDFFQVVEFADSLDLEVNVYTNGTCWTENSVKYFSRLKKRNVQVSIDGFDEESNSQVRGKGSFAKAMQTIDWFVKNGVHVKVAITPVFELLKEYKSEYISFIKSLIEKYGEDNLSANVSHEIMQGRNVSNEQIKSFKKEYYDSADYIITKVFDDFDNHSFVSNIGGVVFDSCGYGALNVVANGDFYFCDRIPDMKRPYGNIRNIDFSEISKLMRCAEDVGRIGNLKPCGDCEIRNICGGGCRIVEFKGFSDITDVEHVDFNKIEPRTCDYETKARFYKLMVENNERFYK